MIIRDETRKRILERIEAVFEIVDHHTLGIPGIVRASISRFMKMRGIEGAASISFFMIFSLPPLLILVISVASYYLSLEEIHNLINKFIEDNLPVTAESLSIFVEQLFAQRSAFGIIGLIGLAWSGSGFLMTLTTNVNRAFPTAKPRSSLENRLIAFLMIAVLILLLAISSVFSSIYSVISSVDIPALPFDLPWNTLSHFILVISRFILFLGLFYWVPKTRVGKRAIVWAALFATLAWELTAWGFGWYLDSNLDYFNVLYGSLGTLVALMFWIYLDCLILVYSAFLGAAIEDHHRRTGVDSVQPSRKV